MEQLGYVAYCFARARESTGLFNVLVQSDSRGPAYLVERIDAFLDSFSGNLADLDADHFSGQVDVLRSTLQRKDLTLSDQTDRFWGSISTGTLQFMYAADQIELLGNVTVASLLEFYQTHMLDSASYKKMVIGVYGKERSGDLMAGITNSLDYEALDPTQLHYP